MADVPGTGTNNNDSLRVTRIKLLRPTDTLVLGHVYRLITNQEVMKGMWAKKQAKLKKNDPESEEKPERVKEKQGTGLDTKAGRSEQEKKNQVAIKNERNRPRSRTPANSAAASITRSRAWQPSLRSISRGWQWQLTVSHHLYLLRRCIGYMKIKHLCSTEKSRLACFDLQNLVSENPWWQVAATGTN
ncbi:DUF4228 DOMAIN PROTEIN [Salix viminalis]|uniref:DUF4228 DOMAIN PROTEIN n=1 Tax=Salix viminalis TaxID=40686 RepID=A0A9Q0NVJ9_SALVM|nr:DUF4228 DOMAIN PROTEIN [Salix viminalis]